MGNIIDLNEQRKKNNIKETYYIVDLIKSNNNKLNPIINNKHYDAEEILLLVEELARYENIEMLSKIIDDNKEILYYHQCDLLDIVIGTCNLELLKMLLSKYDKDYVPSIKYKGTCDRAIANKRKDILDELNKRKINII